MATCDLLAAAKPFPGLVPQRGDLLTGGSELVVHDHWAPYFKMEGVQHALCNAHHLRELQALLVIEKEPWATEMKTFLLDAKAVADTRTDDCTVGSSVMGELLQRYDEILAQAVTFHEAQPPLQPILDAVKRRGRRKRRTCHNLALRLQNRKTEVICFLTDSNVPFTNNEAERDLRMGKVRQKVSGCFCVVRGPRSSATCAL